jgi:uncharacterized protein (UPF0333 family)
MPNLEPTYLRYIYDGLFKGSIHPENAAELPDGLIGMYEEAFDERTLVIERQKLLQRFAIWALLKKEVSAAFVAKVLGETEDSIQEFISTHSAWFNSPESGKYQLYHERLKVYLLQKFSEDSFQSILKKMILTLSKESQSDEIKSFTNEWKGFYFLLNGDLKIGLQFLEANLKEQDANLKDTSINTSNIGSNIAFLFTDTIKKPNNDINLSWATGYNTNKPFSVGSKQLYNLTTNSAISKTADTCVGIAYLDKGMLVLTNSTILSAYTASATTATTISFNSYSRKISQNVTCIANRGEFGFSSNKTFSSGDTPRISEVIFYDINKKVLAVAKTDRQISRNANQFLAIGVKFDF